MRIIKSIITSITIDDIESLTFLIGYFCMFLGIASMYILGVSQFALNLCYVGVWLTVISISIFVYK